MQYGLGGVAYPDICNCGRSVGWCYRFQVVSRCFSLSTMQCSCGAQRTCDPVLSDEYCGILISDVARCSVVSPNRLPLPNVSPGQAAV